MNKENDKENVSPVEDENKDSTTVGIEHIVSGVDSVDTVSADAVDNDVVVDVDDDRGLIEQDDNVVQWHIEGLYDDDGKLIKPRQLERNPPLLVLSDSLGNEASFTLTKNLSFHLYRGMESVYKSYFGVASKSIHQSDSSWKIRKLLPFIIVGLIVVIVVLISQFS